MVRFLLSFFFICSLVSCSNNSNLSSSFNCSNVRYSNLKTYTDVKKSFKIKIPENWKTELYYDNYQSRIYSADTTQQLTETFILDISFMHGELNLNNAFIEKMTNDLSVNNGLNTINSKLQKFKNKDCCWIVSSGIQMDYPVRLLNLYIKNTVDTYFIVTIKVYGNNRVDERICKALYLIENIESL